MKTNVFPPPAVNWIPVDPNTEFQPGRAHQSLDMKRYSSPGEFAGKLQKQGYYMLSAWNRDVIQPGPVSSLVFS